jgi:hypothetical protein
MCARRTQLTVPMEAAHASNVYRILLLIEESVVKQYMPLNAYENAISNRSQLIIQ